MGVQGSVKIASVMGRRALSVRKALTSGRVLLCRARGHPAKSDLPQGPPQNLALSSSLVFDCNREVQTWLNSGVGRLMLQEVVRHLED